MIVWATIVAEELHGHWSAWFKNEPGTGFGGANSEQAIQRLIEASDPEIYDVNQMHPIEAETRDGHLEFLIQMHGSYGLPEPSRN